MLLNVLGNISGRYLQFLCAIIMSLTMVVYGIATSWPSQTLPRLLSENTPLPSGPISEFETSLLNSILFTGGIFGAPTFGMASRKFGRKWLIVVTGAIHLASWVLIAVATSVSHLIASRLLCGIAASGVRTLVPTFYSEIAEKQIRGTIGTFTGISYSLGVIVGSIICDSMPFYDVPYVPIVLLGFFFLIIIFPDTPQSLLLQNRDAEAEAALKFYRQMTPNDQIMEEFYLQKSARDKSGEHLTLEDFRSPGIQKVILVCVVIGSLCHLTGLQPLGMNSVIILSKSGSSFNMHTITTYFYVIQFISMSFAAVMLDRLGRRLTMILALSFNTVFLIIFGTYYYLLSVDVVIPEEYEWILIFSFYGISASAIFLFNVPAVITNEICPTKVRTIIGSAMITLQWIVGAVALQIFLPIISAYGVHSCVYFFAAWTAIELFFVTIMLPETNGHSTEEIVQTFNEKTIHCRSWKASMTMKKI